MKIEKNLYLYVIQLTVELVYGERDVRNVFVADCRFSSRSARQFIFHQPDTRLAGFIVRLRVEIKTQDEKVEWFGGLVTYNNFFFLVPLNP